MPSNAEVANGLRQVAGAIRELRREMAHFKPPEEDAGEGPSSPNNGEPVKVTVAMTIRRLFNLDTYKQTFGAQVHVRMRWKMPPGESPPEGRIIKWEPNWRPRFRVRRVMEEKMSTTFFAAPKIDGVQYIESESDILVDLYEQLELASFPVDVQDLRVAIISLMSVEEVRWLPWPDEGGKSESSNERGKKIATASLQTDLVALNDFQVVQEIPIVWELKMAHLEEDVCVLAIDVKTKRKATYYILNVALVMFVIVSLVLCSWAVHPGDIQARHNVDYMLLLTAVAYKLVLTSTLPPVSYVTIMDVYIMFGFLFLTLVILVHTMLPFSHTKLVDNSPLTMPSQFNSEEEGLIEADRICFRVFAGTWGAWNVIYFVFMYVHGRRVYNQYVADSHETQAKNDKKAKALADGALGARTSATRMSSGSIEF